MKIPKILLTMTASIALVTILKFSALTKNTENGFTRLIKNYAVKTSSLDIKFNSYYYTGASKTNLYFGNVTAPSKILVIGKDLRKEKIISITSLENIDNSGIQIKIDSPNIYIFNIKTYKVLRSFLNQTTTLDTLVSGNNFYSDIIPVDQSNFIIRTLDSNNEYSLAKLASPNHLILHKNVLKKQIDGLFCVDGTLNYDKESGNITYVYYYRNQYITLDSSFNNQVVANTIDTTSKAKIKVAYSKSTKTSSLSEPPKVINKFTSTYHKYLFINSALKADNETTETFQNSTVIDIYDIVKKSYSSSLYIPTKKISWFSVVNDTTLFTLEQNHLVQYRILINN